MSLKIVTYPNPLLGKPSLPITEVTDEIRKLAEEMTEAMYKSDGIGIAAPQVGQLIRLVIIDVTGPEKREGKMVLVNPVWTPLPDAGYVESEEGCLSVPDYRSKVRRTAPAFPSTSSFSRTAPSRILEDYYRVHAPKLQNIYNDKPVGALKRKPQRLPVRDTPHDDSGFEIDRLDMQVVQHIQPRPPGIFV